MAIPTQGTELYFFDPDTDVWTKVGCPTALSGISAPKEQVETTCLDSDARTYIAGLATPGTASITIQADPRDASHLRLHELYKTSTDNLDWALGWSDGKGIPPTGMDTSGPVLPATRTWLAFEGYVSDFPFDFALNSVVTSAVTLQVSGAPDWIAKA